MKNFESVFIMKADVTEEQVANALKDIKKIVDVKNVEEWGRRKLAYPIQKQNEGYYILFEFQKEDNIHDKLQEYYEKSELIIKHIIVAKD